MKNLKILLVVALCFGAFSTVSAQITQGEPSAKTIRTGNRPGAGCFGFYLGATSDMLKGAISKDLQFKALPLLNLKYMSSDNSEWRLGLELYQSSETLKGDAMDLASNTISSRKDRFAESSAMFYPGWAYHFSRHNILDVYAGVEIPFGWNSASSVAEDSAASSVLTTKKSSFVIGLGAFVGFQAFIANLPLAVGLEYGISSRFDAGLKYKNTSTIGAQTQISYTPAPEAGFSHIQGSDAYSRLKAKKGGIGNQVRLTLSYYFK